MKKILLTLCALLAFVLLLSLSACGGDGDSSAEASPSPSAAPSAAPKASATPKASQKPKATATPKPTPTPEPTEAPTEAPTPTPEPVEQEPVDNDPPPSDEGGEVYVQPSGNDDPEPEPDPEPAPNPADYIGGSVDALYAAFGYPGSSDYGPSCIGPGEDGQLYYSGFTVYTYRENGVETVKDVG